MAITQRLYVVAPRTAEEGKTITKRLVRAPNSAQALRHVADEFVVTLAGQDDIVSLIGAGVKVEDSKAPPAASTAQEK